MEFRINVQHNSAKNNLVVTSTAEPPCPINTLNPIVLRLIFEALVPPSQFLDPSLCAGPDSPFSLAVKASELLTRVCKRWREPALALLYGEIILRSVGQLVALCRTLKEGPNEYPHLIWNIDFAFYIPGRLKTATRNAVAFILNTCPNISHLSFSSAFIDRPIDDPLPSLSPPEDVLVAAVRCIATKVISLKYEDSDNSAASFILPLPLITTFSANLLSLTLSVPPVPLNPPQDTEQHTPITLPPITFPKLKELTLWYRDLDFYLPSMTEDWSFPVLKKLSLLEQPNRNRRTFFVQWFKKIGQRIKHLDLGSCTLLFASSPTDVNFRQKSQREILDHCPHLEHLVLPSIFITKDGALGDWLQSKKYLERNIRVDIWMAPPKSWECIHILLPASLRYQGAETDDPLKNIRLLDGALRHIPDLPFILPPTSKSLDRPVDVHRIPGLCIVETSWCLFRVPDDWDTNWNGRIESLAEASPFFMEHERSYLSEFRGQSDGPDSDEESSSSEASEPNSLGSGDNFEEGLNDGVSSTGESDSDDDDEETDAELEEDEEVLDIFEEQDL